MSPLIRLLASFIALMMAMGIGRFALTPQMPHLLSEGQIDLTGAGLIAAANYLGYFVGAVDSIFARSHHHVRGRLYGGLWLCVLLTLASYWAHGFWPHLLLRFGTGVASAWALVMITGLSQPLAIAAGRPRLGALVFAGPGLGILLTGLLARFSFLLGLPAIALAGLKELWVLLHSDLPAHAWPHLIFGLVVASISAFFAIWGLMRFLERFSTWPFVIYRAVLGIFLIVAVSTGLLS